MIFYQFSFILSEVEMKPQKKEYNTGLGFRKFRALIGILYESEFISLVAIIFSDLIVF